jgi:hypothetical protein
MPQQRIYNQAITIESADWMDLVPDDGTYVLGAVGKFVKTVYNRTTMPGTYPIFRPQNSYLDKVQEHLDKLCEVKLGRDLMAEFIAAGHTVHIRPPGKNNLVGSRQIGCSISQTHANFDDAFVVVRQHLRNANWGAAQQELDASFQAAMAMGHTAVSLAADIQQLQQSYNAQQCYNGVLGPPIAIPARNFNVTANDITNWCNGTTQLTDNLEVRYLLLTLERFLLHGQGTDVTIQFDPWAEGRGMLARPPYISLAHELLHALDAVRGTRIFDNDQEEECIYIPCGMFGRICCGGGDRRFTENAFRTAFAKPARTLI